MGVLRRGYRVPFSPPPPLFLVPIPLPSYSPSSPKGVALREEVVALLAKGAIEPAPPLSGLLQPPVRRVEDIGLVEACDRIVPSQWVRPSNTFQDGDQSVDSLVCSERQLDGLHRPEGCIPSGPCASGQPSLLAGFGRRAGLPVSSTLFWTLPSSSGLHQGHGSCLAHSPS